MSRLGDGLSLLLIAFLVDAAVGGFPGVRDLFGAPAAFVRAATGWLERRLNRQRRSPAARRLRGILVALVVAITGWAAGLAAEDALRVSGLDHDAQGVAEAAVLLFLVWQRRPFDLARRVSAALGRGDRAGAARALAQLAGHDARAADDHALARGAVAATAGYVAAGMVGVSLWYLAFGLPGACLYRAVHEAAARIGPPTPRAAAFGLAAARLDALAGLVPAPVAGAILALAAVFVPGARPLKAFAVMFRDFAKPPLPGSGWTEGAAAGALGLALGGPRPSGGETAQGPWIGDGRARAGAADVGRASYLFAVAALVHAGLLAAARLALAGM